MPQTAVALANRLDKFYYEVIEGAEHNVAVANLEKIAIALNVNISEFFKSN